jgi:HAE1 family hydrophobic/amphiphilic exporter-1
MPRRRHALPGALCRVLIGWGLCLGPAAAAPEEPPAPAVGKPENPFARLFHGNYLPPEIRALERGGDEGLEALVKEGKLRLAEADVVRLALANNVDINVERYAPYFSLWGVEKGRGVLDPTLAFRTNVDRLVTPATSVLQGSDTLLNLNTLYDFTVHKPFESGLDLDVGYSTKRLRTSSLFYSINPSLATGLNVNVTQHLLRDFGRISRARFVRIARNNLGMSQEDFVARATETLTAALNTYWDLVYAQGDLKVREESVRLATLVLEQNRIQAEVGTMAPLDVAAAEAEVAARTEELVVARFNKRAAEDQLKKMISSRLDPGTVAAEVEPLTPPNAPPAPPSDLAQAIQRALELRPEVKRQALDQENRRIQVDYARNQLLPLFDFVAGYSQNGLGGTRILRDYSQGFFNAPIIGVDPGGLGTALDSLFSRRYLGYVVGFNFKVPIGNTEARATSAQAQIDYRQGNERLRALRQRIATEVRDAYDRIERDRARVAAAQATIRYAEQRLRGEEDKYAVGATTTRAVFEAQRDLRDAASREVRARVDLVKSRIALDKAVGDVFTAHNIEVKEALRLFR